MGRRLKRMGELPDCNMKFPLFPGECLSRKTRAPDRMPIRAQIDSGKHS
jgi:hypothetical protein